MSITNALLIVRRADMRNEGVPVAPWYVYALLLVLTVMFFTGCKESGAADARLTPIVENPDTPAAPTLYVFGDQIGLEYGEALGAALTIPVVNYSYAPNGTSLDVVVGQAQGPSYSAIREGDICVFVAGFNDGCMFNNADYEQFTDGLIFFLDRALAKGCEVYLVEPPYDSQVPSNNGGIDFHKDAISDTVAAYAGETHLHLVGLDPTLSWPSMNFVDNLVSVLVGEML